MLQVSTKIPESYNLDNGTMMRNVLDIINFSLLQAVSWY